MTEADLRPCLLYLVKIESIEIKTLLFYAGNA